MKSPYADVPCSVASNPAISSSAVTLSPTVESITLNTRSNPIKRNFKQAPLKKMSFQDFKDIGKLSEDSKQLSKKASKKQGLTDVI